MSVANDDTANQFATVGTDAADLDGYGVVTLENDEILLYARGDADQWIQSDDYIDLAFMM